MVPLATPTSWFDSTTSPRQTRKHMMIAFSCHPSPSRSAMKRSLKKAAGFGGGYRIISRHRILSCPEPPVPYTTSPSNEYVKFSRSPKPGILQAFQRAIMPQPQTHPDDPQKSRCGKVRGNTGRKSEGMNRKCGSSNSPHKSLSPPREDTKGLLKASKKETYP